MSTSIIICIPWNTFVVSKHKTTLKKAYFYIVQYPVRWTAQNALHFSSPGRPVNSDINSASLGSIPVSPHQLHANTIHSHFPCCLYGIYSQVLINTAESTEAS